MDITQNFESDWPRHCSREKWFKYAEWFFIEGEKVRMPTERRTAGWHMYQGVVHTSPRLRSRIYNNSLGKRLLFRAWNFPRSKQASSQQRCLWIREVIWFHESESKYTPVPGRGYAPAKIFGGGLNWCPSTHPLQRKSRFHSGRD